MNCISNKIDENRFFCIVNICVDFLLNLNICIIPNFFFEIRDEYLA